MPEENIQQLSISSAFQTPIKKSRNSSSKVEKVSNLQISQFSDLTDVKKQASMCEICRLCETRINVVFSDGNPHAKLMIIGEGPGQNEDETGLPFVGRAGKLLDKILVAAQIDRQKDTYICNIVKCRPPQNRVPTKEEAAACKPYLMAQIEFIRPAIILLAGSTAVQYTLQLNQPISKIRGKWFDYCGAKAMPIFHPSYLLRNDSKEPGSPKWLMWQDIKQVKQQLLSFNEKSS
jgi:uracil-DNA glycosylase family 4